MASLDPQMVSESYFLDVDLGGSQMRMAAVTR